MFRLPAALTFANAKEVQQGLIAHLLQQEPSGEVVIDAGALQDLDAAGLQLLLAACKSFSAKGRSPKLVNMSPLVRHLVAISGGTEIAAKEAAGNE